MSKLPNELLQSLEGIKGFNREAFVNVHESDERITSIRLNPLKRLPAPDFNPVPWTESGYYLDKRPSFTFDPLFHAGCYYVQEASSMFLEQAMKQTIDLSRSLKVLDISAAPGGKSTHIHSLITKDSLLVSNEVIRSRANILKDNIIKWGCDNVIVTNSDPSSFSDLENYFDVIVADAPCSGSGLFRRDDEAIDEWSLNNVQLCSQRQQRILAHIWPSLKKDGVLIYSTCSYSKEEDEDIMDWLVNEMSAESLQLTIDASWGITEVQSSAGASGYRFWPDKVKGEGFFISCFKKTTGDDEFSGGRNKKLEKATKKEIEVIKPWLKESGMEYIKINDTVSVTSTGAELSLLATYCRVIYFGVMLGQPVRDKLVPDHALAMSKILSENIHATELSLEQAIRYLQKKDISIDTGVKGWQVVSYQLQKLGWINALPNRINNYYPKELRILKDI